jgi:hypothetical protein
MPLPDLERLAHHEAGHAVVQHRIARGRYRVTRVSLESDGESVAGSSDIDTETDLGLYEFGMVVLAGIEAENRYFSEHPPPQGDIWGAVGDTEEWLSAARNVLKSDARVEIVTRNVLKRLRDFFDHAENWGIVCKLAGLLVAEGGVEGKRLQDLLEDQQLSSSICSSNRNAG